MKVYLYLLRALFSGKKMGSHAGEHKLGGGFVSIPCLPPHLVAKMESILLVIICYAKDLKTFGNEKIFRKAIDDFHSLSTKGIKLNIDDQEITVYFECVLILGDKLGLNTICGFYQNFSKSKYYCRICTASQEQCKTLTTENKNLLRTLKSNEADILIDPSLYGIKEYCIFNRIPKFHISKNVTVDAMHDVPEGVAVYSTGKVLESLIDKKIITLEELNRRIETFPYNDVEKSNKPMPLFYTQGKKCKKLKIKQSASEMLCLVRYLGLMIGDLIPAGNENWKLYQYIRRAIGIITSPKLNISEIAELKKLISKHNALYITLYGPLKPKMHIWTHYPTVTIRNGPVCHFSSLMFERKNRKLKEIAVGTSSNINLPLTIGIRHQLQLCYTKEFCTNAKSDITYGPIDNKNAQDEFLKLIPNINKQLDVKTFKHIEILHHKFSEGTILITRIDDKGPHFDRRI
ncbi:uncharacterized protein LOC127279603 [Leptopilina boulardi]|uniref:uncharacterized protein LOC127279603 n=1 Tax=Leptopilina boulardi TaxID=63433 RepID=UPI0021F671F2|nr:uncharacterized protein LOC127279603 [Leptopilina boulardi]